MNPKYTFTYEYGTKEDGDHEVIQHIFSAETYDEIIEHFQQFLQGAGFSYILPGTIVYDPEQAEC